MDTVYATKGGLLEAFSSSIPERNRLTLRGTLVVFAGWVLPKGHHRSCAGDRVALRWRRGCGLDQLAGPLLVAVAGRSGTHPRRLLGGGRRLGGPGRGTLGCGSDGMVRIVGRLGDRRHGDTGKCRRIPAVGLGADARRTLGRTARVAGMGDAVEGPDTRYREASRRMRSAGHWSRRVTGAGGSGRGHHERGWT